MTDYIKAFIKNNRFAFAAFLLPVLVMVLAFAVTGVYPFGSRQIAVIDMYHQYVPFLGELQYKLQEGAAFFIPGTAAAEAISGACFPITVQAL